MRKLALIFIAYTCVAAELPPLPPGYRPPLRAPRQLVVNADKSMSRSVAAPPATNAPAMLIIRGWDTLSGERIPLLALRFGTNAPHATIFTRTFNTDWRCFTKLDNIVSGSVREFGWCPTKGQSGMNLFKIVLHD